MVNNEMNELGRTEELLKQFAPPPVNIDRERLMFLAGQAEAESRVCRLSLRERQVVRGANDDSRANGDYRHKLWPLATLAMTGIAATLAIALAIQLSQPLQERIVVREVQVALPPAPVLAEAVPTRDVRPPSVARSLTASVVPNVSLALPASSVFQMRNMALRFGVEALPAAPSSNSGSASSPSAWGRLHELREVEATTKAGL